MSILVVDDDPIFLDSLAGLLRAAGYDVQAAREGGEALAICRRARVRLIIADWIMPGMDGVNLCRALKTDPLLRQTYVILLTAREEIADKIQALDAGADEYVVKPCVEGEILARVRAGLRIRRLQEELAEMEWRLATRELAAALGHSINNPLAAIANYLELLAQSESPEASDLTADVLRGARQEVERIAAVIRRLMNLRDPRRIPTALGFDMIDLGQSA